MGQTLPFNSSRPAVMKTRKTPPGQKKAPAKRVIQVRIPALERFIKDARPWGLVERHPQGGWGGKAYDQQRTDPDTKDLLKKVGMKGGDRVLLVATTADSVPDGLRLDALTARLPFVGAAVEADLPVP